MVLFILGSQAKANPAKREDDDHEDGNNNAEEVGIVPRNDDFSKGRILSQFHKRKFTLSQKKKQYIASAVFTPKGRVPACQDHLDS